MMSTFTGAVETKEQGLRRAQALVAEYISPDSLSLVDDLLEERRRDDTDIRDTAC